MKKLLFVFLFVFLLLQLRAQEVKIDECQVTIYRSFETVSFQAYGNVYVETNPKNPVDLYVKIVNQPKFADFCVYKTSEKPQDCGEWRFVSDRKSAKFTIRYVEDNADCYVFFVKERKDAGAYYIARQY